MFVNLAHDNGVRSFSLVHDSYGSLAADVPLVSKALREAFVMLYQGRDVLEEFARHVTRFMESPALKQIPSKPPVGTLDLGRVLQSEYFFA